MLRSLLCGVVLLFVTLVTHGVAVADESVHLVWSGHPVGFDFLYHKDAIYVAFYDENQMMTLGKSERAGAGTESPRWQFQTLDSKIGWDSHNYVTIQFDSNDFLHVSGNMHGVPLVYFRADKPCDIASVKPVHKMVGTEEKRVTYPRFLFDNEQRLLFTYRDGGSGNGNQFWNVYDAPSKTWSRLLDKPLFDGQGLMNAYFTGPSRGQDGYFHLCWVWRDTGDCATNHDLCYARSADLRNWERSDGKPQPIPITLDNSEVVDAVPAQGGLLNSFQRIGFDPQGRVILTHSKYDDAGNFQVINSRLEKDGWKHYQTSDWQYRWDFRGGGTIGMEVNASGVTVRSDGRLQQSWEHIKYGSGTWILDAETLRPILEPLTAKPKVSNAVREESVVMRHHSSTVRGGNVVYTFTWDTLPANRDRPPTVPAPEPAMLKMSTKSSR
ncbi:MAG: BNR repeat-containing protein [Thermoguttaceae bacterium]